MSWNYRIVKYPTGGFGLHEVHYDKDGEPIRMTEQPAGFVADSPEELRSALMLAKMDAQRRPIFEPPERWKHDTDDRRGSEAGD